MAGGRLERRGRVVVDSCSPPGKGVTDSPFLTLSLLPPSFIVSVVSEGCVECFNLLQTDSPKQWLSLSGQRKCYGDC